MRQNQTLEYVSARQIPQPQFPTAEAIRRHVQLVGLMFLPANAGLTRVVGPT
jgi:hypothetical protein